MAPARGAINHNSYASKNSTTTLRTSEWVIKGDTTRSARPIKRQRSGDLISSRSSEHTDRRETRTSHGDF